MATIDDIGEMWRLNVECAEKVKEKVNIKQNNQNFYLLKIKDFMKDFKLNPDKETTFTNPTECFFLEFI